MKKGKRILAILGVVLLVSLYVITFICAITDSTATMNVFFASIVATAIIPVLMWAYSFIYKLLKDNYGPDSRKDEDAPDEEEAAKKEDA